MNLTFNVCDIGNRQIRIEDLTQNTGEYVPENLENNDYEIVRYYNYKYSETYTINILQYNKSSEQSISAITYTDHNSYLDESIISIPKDGYYILYHLVLPTIQWLENKLQDSNFDLNIYSGIYVTDGESIFKLVNDQLVKCDDLEVMYINTENTTISREEKKLFYFFDLYNCYINLCNELFDKSIIKCVDKNTDLKDLRYNRDFMLSTINVIKFYIENSEYESAQLLLEKLNICSNKICKQSTKYEHVSGCNCS